MYEYLKYLENTPKVCIENIKMTTVFLFLPIAGYAGVHFENNYWILCIAILYCVWVLFYFLMIPAYKIYTEKAECLEMNSFKFAPIGIGLLSIYWKPYIRMAKKLASNEAIRACENAVKNMESMRRHDLGSLSFMENWNTFRNCFPKIEASDEARNKRCTLTNNVLKERIRYEGEEIRRQARVKLYAVMCARAYKEMNLADFLRVDLLKGATSSSTYKDGELADTPLKKEYIARTLRFRELWRGLTELNVDLTFKEMNKIKN